MILYPAIDLRGGRVVRLREGDPSRQIEFSDSPIETARAWIDQGAQWLHMVNLDGAFARANANLNVLEAVAALGIPIQFGGGLRSEADIEQAINAGAARVILGTVALEQPEIVASALVRYGADRVCVALDSKDGRVATHGWQVASDQTPEAVGRAMAARGVRHALFTDIKRDGGLQGVNLEATVALARATGLQVIASGGVSTVEEIRALAQSRLVAGAVIGMALYERRLTLRDALAAAQEK